MEINVENKIAVITGSTRGLGYSMAKAMILGKAKGLVLNSRKKEECLEAYNSLKEFSVARFGKCTTEIVAIPGDMSDGESIYRFLKEVAKQFPKIDILIANAGATWGADIEEYPESGLNKVLDLNLKGVFLTVQKFLPLLEKPEDADPSRIIITSSISGLTVGKESLVYAYSMSKAGIIHLGKQLSVQLPQRYNINVNVICPGFFPSKMSNVVLEMIGDYYKETNPRGRLGSEDDLIPLILYLCDKKSNYMNGCVIPLDGGYHQMGPKI